MDGGSSGPAGVGGFADSKRPRIPAARNTTARRQSTAIPARTTAYSAIACPDSDVCLPRATAERYYPQAGTGKPDRGTIDESPWTRPSRLRRQGNSARPGDGSSSAQRIISRSGMRDPSRRPRGGSTPRSRPAGCSSSTRRASCREVRSGAVCVLGFASQGSSACVVLVGGTGCSSVSATSRQRYAQVRLRGDPLASTCRSLQGSRAWRHGRTATQAVRESSSTDGTTQIDLLLPVS
jgi:hypothetical protein